MKRWGVWVGGLLVLGCSQASPPVAVTSQPTGVEVTTSGVQVQVSSSPGEPAVAKTEVPETDASDAPGADDSDVPDSETETPTPEDSPSTEDVLDVETDQVKVEVGSEALKVDTGEVKVDVGGAAGVRVDLPGTGQVKVGVPGAGAVQLPGVPVPSVDVDVDVEAYLKGFQFVQLPEVRFAGVTVRQGQGRTIYAVPGDVLFDFDRAEIRSDAAKALTEVAQSLQQRHPGAAVLIEGHSDAKGSDSYNLKLSQQRARAVKAWLQKQGLLKGAAMECVGRGESRPVAPNQVGGKDNPEGRQKNRRVELSVAE